MVLNEEEVRMHRRIGHLEAVDESEMRQQYEALEVLKEVLGSKEAPVINEVLQFCWRKWEPDAPLSPAYRRD
ncbi:unnamed protein product [Chrysoparadoxa australica]